MVVYLGRPSLYSNAHQVFNTLQPALKVRSYIAIYLVGYYLATVQCCA